MSIINAPLNNGDIVIQFGFHMWKDGVGKKSNYYKLSDIFNSKQYVNEKCFNDWAPHIDAYGNKIVAHEIFRILEKDMLLGLS